MNNNNVHIPEQYAWLRPEWIQCVRSEASAAEKQGLLTPAQFQLIREQQWFKMLIPISVGGLELSIPEILHHQEAASWMDGSFGWIIALCGGAGFFAGFLEYDIAQSLFNRADICVAGTGYPAGTAEEMPGGYQVSGHWRYASGAPHATLYTANCILTKNGQPLTDETGQPLIKAMTFLPEQVTIEKHWHSMGLVATASHDLLVHQAFVPQTRSFIIANPFPHAAGPLFQYPFLQQAEGVLAITLVGMVRYFLDLFSQTTPVRYNPQTSAYHRVQQKIIRAEKTWINTRTSLYTAIESSWLPYEQGLTATPEQLTNVGVTARQSAATLVQLVQQLYTLGGMQMMNVDAPINRVWRDIHTASQHAILSPLRDH